ncbi:hypothetical protein L208DRAFT_1408086 [Tricholoma matsutake]|nr:hypothetical protein L208DRAFT_1408086 [Tricholoma matsutake 945]
MNLGDDDLRLLCVIEGETERNPKFMVGDLKKKIQEKRKDDSLTGVGAHSLVLWKPKDTNPIDVNLDLASIRSDEQLAEKLTSARPVGYIFPNQPPLDRLHIIVRKPDTGE